jgi:uncharacterized membrane protein (DUF441 family)
MDWWLWACVLLFTVSMLTTIITVGSASSSGDSKNDIKNAIMTVAIVNGILIAVLAGLSYIYVSANTTAERPYILFMVHASLLISIISVSVSCLQKLN